MGLRRRGVAAPGRRSRVVPARSRVTLRRSEAPLVRSATVASALRDSRAAVCRVESELDALLAALRDPGGRPDAAAADRLRGASSAVDAALARLGGSLRR